MVYPETLDFDKFCNALAKALSLFPTFSGRLVRSGDDWKVRLF
jgi:hypothetical protein